MKKAKRLAAAEILTGIMVAFFVLLGIPKSVHASAASIQPGVYRLSPRHTSDMSLDIYAASTKNEANAQLYKNHNGNSQKFLITQAKEKGYYYITPMCSGLALDVHGGSNKDNANVQQYAQHSGNSQMWSFTKTGNYYYISPKCAPGRVLDAAGYQQRLRGRLGKCPDLDKE